MFQVVHTTWNMDLEIIEKEYALQVQISILITALRPAHSFVSSAQCKSAEA